VNHGWPLVTLQEIAADVPYPIGDGDHGQIKPAMYSNSGVPYIRVADIGWGHFEPNGLVHIPESVHEANLKSELKPGDILIAKTGATIGKCCVVPSYVEKANITSSVGKISVDQKRMLPKFLLYWFLTPYFQKYLWSISTRAAQPGFNIADMKLFKVPLPPLAEQQRLVHVLDEALEGIAIARANAEKNLQNARMLFESHLRFSLIKSGEGWAQAQLGSIGRVLMCKRILKEQTNQISGVPFYKIGTFGKVADSYIPVEVFEKYRSQFAYPKRGEVLLSAAGTIGRRVTFDGEPSYFQDSNIVWIKNDESVILNEYLYHYYSICDFKPSIGTTIKRLYNADLRSVVVFFPQSLAMQRKLVSQIVELESAAEHLVSLYGRKLDQLHAVSQSIFQHAFSGQLEAAS